MKTEHATLGVGVVGLLWVAISGLERTAKQIEGATLYQIARDGRDLSRKYTKNEVGAEDVLSYFHSAFLLHNRDVIDDPGWRPIARALCFFLLRDKHALQKITEFRSLYDPNFLALVDKIEGEKKCVESS